LEALQAFGVEAWLLANCFVEVRQGAWGARLGIAYDCLRELGGQPEACGGESGGGPEPLNSAPPPDRAEERYG